MLSIIEKLNRALDALHQGTGTREDVLLLLERLHCHLLGEEAHISTQDGWDRLIKEIKEGETRAVFYMNGGITRIFAEFISSQQRWGTDLTSDSSSRAHRIWMALRQNDW
jgi:hypothetical protein